MSIQKKLIVFTLASLLLTGQWVAFTMQVTAANTDNFKAGNIIDDTVFTNGDDMNVSQIQSFLEAKNSVCLKNFKTLSLHDANNDGYGDEPYGKGTGNKVRASKLIHQAAQIYDINPKVILVTLQKEQGLITRDDCPNWRYNTALGYGCPDGEPCDNTAYGFTRQIDYGVWHFRGFFDDSMSYVPYTPGTNKIYYHPDLNRCGSTKINIQNRATASLYSYTPYQPNQAALDAGYGTGDSCSSYGNRNFWMYFTDWFGSTRGTPFFQVDGDSRVYMKGKDETYYYVPSPTTMGHLGFGKQFTKIQKVKQSYLDSLTPQGAVDSRVINFGDAPMYVYDEGKLHHIPSSSLMTAYGYSSSDVIYADNGFKFAYDRSKKLGSVLGVAGTSPLYSVESGKKRHITSPTAYKTLGDPVYSERSTIRLSKSFAKTVSEGAPIFSSGVYTSTKDTNKHFIWDGSALMSVDSSAAPTWHKKGYKTTSSLLSSLPKASNDPITNFVTDSANNKYLVDRKHKYSVDDATLNQLGITGIAFTTVPDTFLKRFQAGTDLGSLLRNPKNGAVYYIHDGAKIRVNGPSTIKNLGISWDEAINMSPSTIKRLLPGDHVDALFGSGRVIKTNDSPRLYVVDGLLQIRHAPSPDHLQHFGLAGAKTSTVSSTAFNMYAQVDSLRYLVKDGGGRYWLVHNGEKSLFNSDQVSRYGNILTTTNPIDKYLLDDYKRGHDVTSIVKADDDTPIYRIEDGKKRHFVSPSALEKHGADGKKRTILPDELLEQIPDGENLK